MLMSEVKLEQQVKVTGYLGGLFCSEFEGQVGRVVLIEDDFVTVRFEDGDEDYGYPKDLELVIEVEVPATVRQAIEDVEKALAILKGLVG